MIMKTVYFVRHGETLFNREKRLQGWRDSSLSEQGKEQARIVAEAVSALSINRAIVSPLGRAQETAEIIRAKTGLATENDPHLREVSFGDFEGHTLPELDVKFPGMWEARMADKWNYRPPGGEANKDAIARAAVVIRRIEEQKDGEALLVIAHFAINRIIFSLLADIEPDEIVRINVPHCAIYRAQKENGEWRLSYLDAERADQGFQPGWLIQYVPENLPTGG
ncbi:MAG: histidine phosphatase family protein [Candidatus Omnitrophota bacterium]